MALPHQIEFCDRQRGKDKARDDKKKKYKLRGQDWSRIGPFWMRRYKNELALEFDLLGPFKHGHVC